MWNVAGVDQEGAGYLADLQALGGEEYLGVAPGGELVGAEAGADVRAEPACVAAVVPPGGQPAAQPVVVEQGPCAELFGDLTGGVHHEGQVAGWLDAMHPALGVTASVDAGRAEPGPQDERGHGVTSLVPRGDDACPPGVAERGEVAAVVATPEPQVVHDGFVVVTDQPAQLGPDRGQRPLLCRGHVPASPHRDAPGSRA